MAITPTCDKCQKEPEEFGGILLSPPENGLVKKFHLCVDCYRGISCGFDQKAEEKKTTNKLLTLCLIHQHPKILLGVKKRGFGMGKWNGLGGKVDPGETIEEAAKREVQEEAGIEINNLDKVGIVEFEFQGNPEILEVHIFRSDDFSGEPVETEEIRPRWYHVDEIPFAEMWADDIYWMPLFLSGKKFKGKFLFGETENILEHELIEVEEI